MCVCARCVYVTLAFFFLFFNKQKIWLIIKYSHPFPYPVFSHPPILLTHTVLYASFSGPAPTACLSSRWRTWWSWVTNLTPNVSLPTCSLWSTTYADTRCPWVGPVTSDLCSVKGPFSMCAPLPTRFTSLDSSPGLSSPDDTLHAERLGHRVAHLWWRSWGLCVCVCVSVCLLSLLAVVVFIKYCIFSSILDTHC